MKSTKLKTISPLLYRRLTGDEVSSNRSVICGATVSFEGDFAAARLRHFSLKTGILEWSGLD